MLRAMVLSQGYVLGERNELVLPDGKTAGMTVPTELLPTCPNCGRPLTMNLRSDDKFVEDEGWHKAAVEYEVWLTAHQGQKVVFMEIGVGYNTPGIIKYNFWKQVYQNPNATYVCLNMEDSPVPDEIKDRSVLISGDSNLIILELASKP